MKKYFACLLLLVLIFVTGCGKYTKPVVTVNEDLSHFSDLSLNSDQGQITYHCKLVIKNEDSVRARFKVTGTFWEDYEAGVIVQKTAQGFVDGDSILTLDAEQEKEFSVDFTFNLCEDSDGTELKTDRRLPDISVTVLSEN